MALSMLETLRLLIDQARSPDGVDSRGLDAALGALTERDVLGPHVQRIVSELRADGILDGTLEAAEQDTQWLQVDHCVESGDWGTNAELAQMIEGLKSSSVRLATGPRNAETIERGGLVVDRLMRARHERLARVKADTWGDVLRCEECNDPLPRVEKDGQTLWYECRRCASG